MQAAEIPRWVVLQLVEACNLRCAMCYEWGEGGTYHQRPTATLDLGLIRRVVEDCRPGRPFFELFGGEPFLHPHIDEVIRLVGEAGSPLGIPTNGTLVDRHLDSLVGDAPIRLWFSVDGPEAVNDRQRGPGSFRRAMAGLDAVHGARAARGRPFPELGLTCIVTPVNAHAVAELFLAAVDLDRLDFVIVVLQNFATEAEWAAWETLVTGRFGATSAAHARGYVVDPARFAGLDLADLADQIEQVRRACRERGVLFFSQPTTTDVPNLGHYFAGRWPELADRRSRCAFPWMYAEVSARGEVTPCHTFYDLTVGSLHDRGLLDIWRGEPLARVRDHLRRELFPICTACCRYYNSPTASRFGEDPTRPVDSSGLTN